MRTSREFCPAAPTTASVRREPLLVPALSFASGIALAASLPAEATSSRLLIGIALAALAVLLTYLLDPAQKLRLSALAAFLLIAGAGTQVLHRPGPPPKLDAADGDTVLLEGCITNPPVFSPGREQMTLKLGKSAAIRLSVKVQEGSTPPALSYGERVEAATMVRSPRNFQNPGAFDYVAYLAAQHIFWTGYVADATSIRILPGACGYAPTGWLYRLRTWSLNRLERAFAGDQHTLGLLEATLLGETSGTERRWTDEFRVTGTYHAIVISGLHVSILAFCVLFLLRLAWVPRIPALCIASCVCWIYAFLAGGNAPVLRAASGFLLYLIGSLFFRRSRILNLISALALVWLVVDPQALFDPAFQLSFLSAIAIGAFALPLIERYVHPVKAAVRHFDQVRYDPKVEARAATWRVEFRLLAATLGAWGRISEKRAQTLLAMAARCGALAAEMVLMSACIQFALALPMISYFHRLSVTGLTANLIVVPLLTAVVPAGFATILTCWHPLAALTAFLLHCAESSAAWHVRWEPAWRIAAIPLPVSVAFCLALVVLALVARHRRRLVLPAFAVALTLFLLICVQPWRPLFQRGSLEVTAVDVSQGDSLLIVFPDGKTMLVDAGGIPGMERMKRKPNLDYGEDVVSPYLWSRRIQHLDYVALTHGHSDHMAGLSAILDNFRPSALWIGPQPVTKEWTQLEEHAHADRVPLLPLHRGSPDVIIGGARVHVLAPGPDYVPATVPKNDDSLVLQITFGKRSVLLTGDAERPVEEDLLASGELRPVTLLKVGHHGSRTSSSEAFLDRVAPQFAFISDGYQNQFHHPHEVVLQRLRDRHVSILRTDQQGLLTFLTDGEHVEVHSFR